MSPRKITNGNSPNAIPPEAVPPGTLRVAEAELNQWLEAHRDPRMHDLRLTLLQGRMRVQATIGTEGSTMPLDAELEIQTFRLGEGNEARLRPRLPRALDQAWAGLGERLALSVTASLLQALVGPHQVAQLSRQLSRVSRNAGSFQVDLTSSALRAWLARPTAQVARALELDQAFRALTSTTEPAFAVLGAHCQPGALHFELAMPHIR